MFSLLPKAVKKPLKHLRYKGRKAWSHMWKLRYKYNILAFDKDKINRDFKEQKLFFILGSGRSGTQLLSGLLNSSNSALVLHEPQLFEDRLTRNASRENMSSSLDYISTFRKLSIYNSIIRSKKSVYGEVTGTLRYHILAIKEVFPSAQLFILARDGRDVVRSIMGYNFYTSNSDIDGDTSPLPGSELNTNWINMSRFQKICWLWADSYKVLLDNINTEKIIHFEKIINDYEYFNNTILAKLDITVDKKTWNNFVEKKSNNASKTYSYPQWKEWSQEDRNSFDSICGDIMKKIGYDYHWD